MNTDLVERLRKLSERQELKPDASTVLEAAAAIEALTTFDIRQLPEGLYTVKNGIVYTARVRVSGGNVLNMRTGESHWEDDRIVGGEQVFPKPEEVQDADT